MTTSLPSAWRARAPTSFARKGQIVGTAGQIPAQLRELEAAGVQGVMLQWIDDLDDIEGIAALGQAIKG